MFAVDAERNLIRFLSLCIFGGIDCLAFVPVLPGRMVWEESRGFGFRRAVFSCVVLQVVGCGVSSASLNWYPLLLFD